VMNLDESAAESTTSAGYADIEVAVLRVILKTLLRFSCVVAACVAGC
jgi:hypothetical protein